MKIRYSDFHPDPSLRGTINDKLPRHRALAAIDSGLATEIPYASAQERLRSETPWAFESVDATVRWSVAQGMVNGRYYISAKCSRPQCSTLTYDAPPSAAIESITFLHSCGCAHAEKVPAQIAEQYRKQFKPATTLGKDEARYYHDARPQVSKPVDPSTWQYPLTGPLREGNEKEGLLNYAPNPGDGKPLDPAFYKYK